MKLRPASLHGYDRRIIAEAHRWTDPILPFPVELAPTTPPRRTIPLATPEREAATL